ncbi:LysM peptidoglycan-binding domain-containing protein [Kineococcus terrestris]|uniref:LysM peptidoglycan-binding domain-containing protein n=1 Tax=Kineococcus terrestris TaxID=2044856 RepID=UPI0034DACBCD
MAAVERRERTPQRLTSVTLAPADSPLAPVTVELIGAARLSPPNSTWDEVARPRRQSYLEWTGYGIQRQSFTCLFAGELRGDELADITAETVKLHHLAIPPGARTPPPLVRLSGPLYGIGPGDLWVIESITPGAPWRRDSDGRVCLNTYEVALAQHVAHDVITNSTKAAATSPAREAADRQGAPAPGPARTYTVVAGDTLSGIAARLLGAASRWPDIANLNGVRDPRSIRPGQVLKLP